jgi:hypothetical protein
MGCLADLTTIQAVVAAEGLRPEGPAPCARAPEETEDLSFTALLLQLAAGAGGTGLNAAAPGADGESDLTSAGREQGKVAIEAGSLLLLMFQNAASSASGAGSSALADAMLAGGLPWELIGSGGDAGDVSESEGASLSEPVADLPGALITELAAGAAAGAPLTGPTAAPAGGPGAASLRVLVQVAYAAAEGARRAVETVSIRLHPPSLGRVEVVLSTNEGRLSASFRVENDQVRQMVESNLDALREALAQAGFAGAGLDVSSFDRRYETMPVGGRRFIGKWIAVEGPGAEAQTLMTARLAWPWSVIDTVA